MLEGTETENTHSLPEALSQVPVNAPTDNVTLGNLLNLSGFYFFNLKNQTQLNCLT